MTEEVENTDIAEAESAETIYLLMTKEHRISKHLRANWYLEHVNRTIQFPYPNEPGHPQLVSVLDKNGESMLRDGQQSTCVKIGTDSTVIFLNSHHSLVFAFDVSISTISSSTADTQVLFDAMYDSFRNVMIGLTKTFIVPGTKELPFEPHLYVTVVAYTPLNNCPVQQVLTHGYLVTHHNVSTFIDYITSELNKFENQVAQYMHTIINEKPAGPSRRNSAASRRGSSFAAVPEFTVSGPEDVSLDEVNSRLKEVHQAPEHGFFHLLKSAMLAISLLPSNCSAGIIVITDGNVGIGDVGRYDNLLIQLLSKSCTCSVIEVQPEREAYKRGLGRIGHSEMLQFIATATFGAYFSHTPCLEDDSSNRINVYHEGVLCWDFRKSIKQMDKYPSSPAYITSCQARHVQTGLYSNVDQKHKTIKQDSYSLKTPINYFIISRLKEGFTIKSVDTSQEKHIRVTMVLPWRKNITVEYHMVSQWPVPRDNPKTLIEIYYDGNYPFLHDYLNHEKTSKVLPTTKYRRTVIERFHRSIISLRFSDECLVAMQSFHTKDGDHVIPESMKSGKMPLFENSFTGQSQPPKPKQELITTLGDATKRLAEYWRTILCMEFGVYIDKFGPAYNRPTVAFEKWFHITHLYVVLAHDVECHENLHIPNSGGRFHSVSCRKSLHELIDKMEAWSDFILLANSHFVKYINRKEDDVIPISGYHGDNWQSYCMIMMNVKGACVSLRLTFLGGTDSIYRGRFLKELRAEIRGLTIQFRPISESNKKRETKKTDCCTLFVKPLDRVLIRYARIPRNLLTVDDIKVDMSSSGPISNQSINPLSRLSNYLHHQRWVWSLSCAGFADTGVETAGAILHKLTRIRLKEGFHFAQANSGIVSLIVEVEMATSDCDGQSSHEPESHEKLSCLVQYITFPPQVIRNHHSVSESEMDEDTDTPGELVLVTECWVEPQHGFVSAQDGEAARYNGTTFAQWPERMFPVDESCIKLQLTFDHLIAQWSTVTRRSLSSGSAMSGYMPSTTSSDAPAPSTPEPPTLGSSDQANLRVRRIPFAFSIVNLLPMCRQAEMCFSLYHMDERADSASPPLDNYYRVNETLMELLVEKMEGENFTEMNLTNEECYQLVEQIWIRPRPDDQAPPPFDEPIARYKSTGTPELRSSDREAQQQSWGSSPSQHLLAGGGGLVDSRLDNSGPSEWKSNDRPSRRNEHEPKERDYSNVARWRCYCRVMVNEDNPASDDVHLILLPASFHDINLLNHEHFRKYNFTKHSSTSSAESRGDTQSSGMRPSSTPERRDTATPRARHSTPDTTPVAAGSARPGSTPILVAEGTAAANDDASDGVPALDFTIPESRQCPSLPIYIYETNRLDFEDRLMKQNERKLDPDLYQSFVDMDTLSAKDEVIDDGETTRRTRRRTVSSSHARFDRTYSMTSEVEESKGIVNSCNRIIDIYYRCFFTGIYESLQKGSGISREDVESAFRELFICDELPLQIPISDFLKHTCGHLAPSDPNDQVFLEAIAGTQVNSPTTPKTVKFAQPETPMEPQRPKRSSGSSEQGKSNLKSQPVARIPLSMLNENSRCSSRLIGRVQTLFLEVISEWFTPIPSCRDYLYYNPRRDRHAERRTESAGSDTDIGGESAYVDPSKSGHSSGKAARPGGVLLIHSGGRSHDSSNSTALSDEPPPPLFIALYATTPTTSINVRSIPVCLAELKDCFETGKEEIDIANLKVSLDITCLTLPPEQELGLAIPPPSPRLPDQVAHNPSHDLDAYMQDILHKDQINDMLSCKKEIDWLVKDEIASAMRSANFITESTLKYVSQHIQDTHNKLNQASKQPISQTTGGKKAANVKQSRHKFLSVELTYVFGPDKSHELFIERFRRMNVPGYLIKEESGYFYLSYDRSRLSNLAACQPPETSSPRSAEGQRAATDVTSPIPDFTARQPSFQVLSSDDRPPLQQPIARVSNLPSIPSGDDTTPAFTGLALAPIPHPVGIGSVGSRFHRADRSPAGSVSACGDTEPAGGESREQMSASSLFSPQIESENKSESGKSFQTIEEDDQEEDTNKHGSSASSKADPDASVEGVDPRSLLIPRPASNPSFQQTLDSLPKYNNIDEWDRGDADEVGSTFGSLPKSFSSCNVNMSAITTRQSAMSNRSRHMSEETERKRATFADEVPSSRSSQSPFHFNQGSALQSSVAGTVSRDIGSPRSRNTSGRRTPGSILTNYTGMESTGSGYDPDHSDDEETTTGAISYAGSCPPVSSSMPNFWLIMKVHAYKVDIYYHCNDADGPKRRFTNSIPGSIIPMKDLCQHIEKEIHSACKIVNQTLLLYDLNSKRKCDPLLEEDESWAENNQSSRHRPDSDDGLDAGSDDDFNTGDRSKYVHGHFRCTVQWSYIFYLHPRLKTAPSRQASSKGYMAIKNALGNWMVVNRRNMFVYQVGGEGNIFYLRLSEHSERPVSITPRPDTTPLPDGLTDGIQSPAGGATTVPEEGRGFTNTSRSASVKSFTHLDPDNAAGSVGEHDDTQSLGSRLSYVSSRRVDEGVKLSVHGITDVDDAIKVDLVKHLQNKLDKGVLQELDQVLSRNPNCLLSLQDVAFIQKRTLPAYKITFSLPDEGFHHQKATLHYLRQNLLLSDSIFRPKYQESEAKFHFLDFTQCSVARQNGGAFGGEPRFDYAPPMIDMNTFLMNKSRQTSRATGHGLVLIYLQLIDSTGKRKRLLDCPKPAPDAWKSFKPADFKRLTEVQSVTDEDLPAGISTKSFIRFSIWYVGEVEINSLQTYLHTSVTHALCDTVCEYHALTAPLCDVPNDVLLPSGSALSQSVSHDKRMDLGELPSSSLPNGSKDESIRSSRMEARFGLASPNHDHYQHPSAPLPSAPLPGTDIRRRSSFGNFSAVLTEVDRYRRGEKGQLLPYHTSTLVDWFEYCYDHNLPSLSKTSCSLLNECVVDPIMKEFEAVVQELSGISIQAFRLVEGSYVPYQTSTAPLPEGEGELNQYYLDFTYNELSLGHVLAARNWALWADSVGDSDGDAHPLSSTPRSTKNNMKFPPSVPGMEASENLAGSQTSVVIDRLPLPRQQFLMLVIKESEVTLYTYNLADDKDDSFQKAIRQSVERITSWNNARYHLLNCIAQQKMGLFNHVAIHKVPTEEKDLPVIQTVSDVEKLYKTSKPPSSDSSKSHINKGHHGMPGRDWHRSKPAPGKPSRKAEPNTKCLDRVYLDCKPSRPMHLSVEGRERDPIHRHGFQLFEIHKNEEHDAKVNSKLEEIYETWQQRKGPVGAEINDVELDILKGTSRLVHHVATPLLLSPYWRQIATNLPSSYADLVKEEHQADDAQRPRHNSGTSLQSCKLPLYKASPSSSYNRHAYTEEAWHEGMRKQFVREYIEYLRQPQQPLEQLGFTTVKVKYQGHSGVSRRDRKHSSGNQEQLVRHRTVDTVQKTMPGGIFILELSFQEVYFVVKLYVFSAAQLPSYRHNPKVSRKDWPYFIELCDRMRDYTHAHSFAHDFHLRYMHKFISSANHFHPKYHVVHMLKDFKTYYDHAPLFSRNALHYDTWNVGNTNNYCNRLYRHIRDHTPGMTPILMSSDDTEETNLKPIADICEYALAYSEPISSSNVWRSKVGKYEVSVIISHDHPNGEVNALFGKLNLEYFVIISCDINRPHKAPAHTLLLSPSDCGQILNTENLSSESVFSTSPIFMSLSFENHRSLEMRQTSSGADASRTTPADLILAEQCEIVRNKLEQMVDLASLQCRRDTLWQQMVELPQSYRQRHLTDFAISEPLMPLMYDDFVELRANSVSHPLSWYDEGLVGVFDSFGPAWFKSLINFLTKKYTELVKTYNSVINPNQQYTVCLLDGHEDVVLLIDCDADIKLSLMSKEETPSPEAFEKLEELINSLCFHMWSQIPV